MNFKVLQFLIFYFLFSSLAFAQNEPTISSNSIDSISTNQIFSDSAIVYVSYILLTSGQVSHVRVEKIICPKCERAFKKNLKEEAIRVISEMPPFDPPKEIVKFMVPLKFMIVEE